MDSSGSGPAGGAFGVTASEPAAVDGARQWVQLIAVGVIIVATQALPTYGGAILIPQMARGLAFNRAEVGGLFSSFMVGLGVLSFVGGFIVNRFGTRAAFALGTAMLATGAGLIATVPLSWGPLALVIGGLVGGATAIGGVIPAVTHVARHFVARRTFAMTFIFCMMSLAGAVGVGVLNLVDGAQHDWRAGWRLVALCAVGALGVAIAVVRDRPDPRMSPAHPTFAAAATGPRDRSAREALGTRLFLLLMLSATGVFIATGLLTGHGLLNLLDLGVAPARAASVIAAFPVAALAGKLLVGAIGDRRDPRMSAGVATVSCGLGLAAMPLSSSFALALLSATLIGLGFGAAIVCTPLVLVAGFGRPALTSLAAVVQGVQTIIGAAVILATGLIFDAGGGYAPIFAVAGLFCCIAGGGLILGLGRPHPPRA